MQLSKGIPSLRSSAQLHGRSTRTVCVTALHKAQVFAASPLLERVDWAALNAELERKAPLEVMDEALKRFGNDIAIAFSGAEDVALIEYANLTGRPFRVFSLDTGRLNPETYKLFDDVEKHYKIRIEYTFPDAKGVMDLVNAKGMFSFYEDGHMECCQVRKVQPLRRKLRTLRAWVTGQRKDQSPGTRMDIPMIQVDPVFEGLEGGPGSLIKFNPLTNVVSDEVWNFLRTMNVPVNALHAKGYVSIGCDPCTRPVLPNQPERDGRWWWEDASKKEWGLQIKTDTTTAASTTDAPSTSPPPRAAAPRPPASAPVPQTRPATPQGPPAVAPFAVTPPPPAAAAAATEVPDLWRPGSQVEALSKEALEKMAAGERDKTTLLVMYAPWCRFCKEFEPQYEELARRLQGSSVRVAKYQADLDRDFGKTLGLVTFPTVVLLTKGRTGVIKYNSTRRDPNALGMWVRSLAGGV